MKNRDRCIRVDLDWGSTGIWLLDAPFQKTAGTNVAYDDFSLPSWLVDRFNVWTEWYNAWTPWKGDKNKPDQKAFEAYGLSLAIDLKRFLGDDHHVEFRGTEIVTPDAARNRTFVPKRPMKMKRRRGQPAGGAYFLPGAGKKSAHP